MILLDQQDILRNSNRLDAIISGIYNYRAIKKLKKLFSLWKPDIVHIHSIAKALSFSIIYFVQKYKIPIVYTLHDYGLLCPNMGLYNYRKNCKCYFYKPKPFFKCFITNCDKRCYSQKLWRWIRYQISKYIFKVCKKIDGYISVSNFSKDLFKDYLPLNKPLKLIHNPIEMVESKLENFVNNNSKITFIYIGRLSAEKGIDLLINAIKEVEANLVLIGDGELFHYCKNISKKIGGGRIKLLGWQNETKIITEMRKCNALVLPSKLLEPAPLSILEAASNNIPSIVANHGGLIEFVENNVSGLYFESNNIDSLKNSMNKIIKNPNLAIFLGNNAKEKFDKLNLRMKTHIEELENFYGIIITNKTYSK